MRKLLQTAFVFCSLMLMIAFAATPLNVARAVWPTLPHWIDWSYLALGCCAIVVLTVRADDGEPHKPERLPWWIGALGMVLGTAGATLLMGEARCVADAVFAPVAAELFTAGAAAIYVAAMFVVARLCRLFPDD